MMRRLRLLQVTGTLDPAYGGPCVVVNELTRSLTDLGHSVDVVTLDPPSADWLTHVPGHPYALGPSRGRYGYSRRLSGWLKQHAADYDACTVHGIWQYQSQAVRAACTRSNVPYFLFVHGALDPWFRVHYPRKHAKKALYWRLFEYRTFRDAEAVLYTCEEEKGLARSSFSPYQATEAITRIGIVEPDGDPFSQHEAFLARYPHLRGKRILLFLGRLHPKKGCDLLLDAFSQVCHRDADLHLVIAGPDEEGTEWQLKALAESLQIADRTTWTGMLHGDLKWGAYRAADTFILTSHSENFGIAIAEALACERPVLITDKVNIWREIARCGAGLVETDTTAGAVALLNRWLGLSDRERTEMRLLARDCFLENFEAHSSALSFASTITAAIGKA